MAYLCSAVPLTGVKRGFTARVKESFGSKKLQLGVNRALQNAVSSERYKGEGIT
jgi:hypothetical protein